MSDVRAKRLPPQRHPSIYRVHYGLPRVPTDMPRPLQGLTAYNRQVAGHSHTDGDKYLGLLQSDNGTILKPIIKDTQKRELDFYTRLNSSDDPDLVEFRKFVPKYLGCKKYTYNGHEQEYIILEDLTQRMLEPCIMDVKIGRKTWDPLASEEKRQKEEAKYAACKQQYGFCIPGYQVYKSGRLHKYNKEHGKKLQGDMVVDAIRNYCLVGSGRGCRALVVSLVAALWRLQRRLASQRRLTLRAASLLLLYDAAKLRDEHNPPLSTSLPAPKISRRHSVHSLSGSNFSGQLTSTGPVYRKVNSVPVTCMTFHNKTFAPPPPIQSPWSEALLKLNSSHSFEHNYDEKLSKIKMNYHAVLDQLANDDPTPNALGTVKVIDFAHAFFNSEEDEAIDENFKEGLDNFIIILENLLKETDDQVF